jgi:hypothetical protein
VGRDLTRREPPAELCLTGGLGFDCVTGARGHPLHASVAGRGCPREDLERAADGHQMLGAWERLTSRRTAMHLSEARRGVKRCVGVAPFSAFASLTRSPRRGRRAAHRHGQDLSRAALEAGHRRLPRGTVQLCQLLDTPSGELDGFPERAKGFSWSTPSKLSTARVRPVHGSRRSDNSWLLTRIVNDRPSDCRR